MIIGSAQIELLLGDPKSLKEKRAIVKSVINRIRTKFNVSIAEVGSNDKWQYAILGICCVSNKSSHANSMISSVINHIEKDGRVVVNNIDIEIL